MNRPGWRILVALDWAAGCQERLHWATAWAEAVGGTVSLLQVLEPRPGAGGSGEAPPAPEGDEGTQAAGVRLSRCLERRIPEGVRGQAVVRRGKLVKEMAAAVRQTGADLLLVGRARRWGWERLLCPSRIRAIVREVPCPVLVIPEVFATRHGPEMREGVAVIGRRVLVPVDGSAYSRAAVRWGAALAKPAEGSLVVFHVAGLHRAGPGRAGEGPAEFRALTAEALEQRLWAWAQGIVPFPARVEALQETGMAGWDVLAATAARERCDLIVVSRPAGANWRRRLGGCLAAQLAAGSSCPVLCLQEASARPPAGSAPEAAAPGPKAEGLELAGKAGQGGATAAQGARPR